MLLRKAVAGSAILFTFVLVVSGVLVSPTAGNASNDPPGGSFTAVTPTRLLDTQADGGVLHAGGERTVRITGRSGIPATDVSAVALNLTTIKPKRAGFLTAYPTGTARPDTWNVTFAKGKSITGFAIVAVGQGGSVTVYGSAKTDFAVDVLGWFSTPATASDRAGLFHPGSGPDPVELTLNPRSSRTVQIAGQGYPAAISAMMVDITVRQAQADGYVTAYPAESARPAVSTISFAPGEVRSNRTIVGIGEGAVSFYNASSGSVVLAVWANGWFSAPTAEPNIDGAYYMPVPPTRVADARNGIGDLGILAPNYSASQQLAGRYGIPDGTGTAFPIAIAATLSALETERAGYVSTSIYDMPSETELWFAAGTTISNTILADRRLVLYNHSDGQTPVTLDVVGYFAQSVTAVDLQPIPGTQWAPRTLAISATGRYVAIASEASNLVPGDTNGVQDGFLWDRAAGTTTRVSVSSTGEQADGPTYAVALSDDGRYVAFTSLATNLGRDGDDGDFDLFVRDLVAGTTTQVNNTLDPAAWNGVAAEELSISAGGSRIAFVSGGAGFVANDTNNCADVFVTDTRSGVTTRVSVSSDGVQGNNNSGHADFKGAVVITGDGRHVAFFSQATTLVAGDTNNLADVFVHDLVTHQTTREDVSSRGEQSQSPFGLGSLGGSLSISDDGRMLAFASRATNLPGAALHPRVYLRDRSTATTIVLPTPGASGVATMAKMSADGTTILFHTDSDWPHSSAAGLYIMRLDTGAITLIRGLNFFNSSYWNGYYMLINRDATHAVVQPEIEGPYGLGYSYVMAL
jgi:Tol biopolymer transport system component